jgi:hypothetical protein
MTIYHKDARKSGWKPPSEVAALKGEAERLRAKDEMKTGAREEILRQWRQTMGDMTKALANLKQGLVRSRSTEVDPNQDIERLEGQIAEFDAFLRKCEAEYRRDAP